MHVVLYSRSALVWRLATIAVAALMAFAGAQALDVQAPSRSGDKCEQSILLQVASSRSGAVALSASYSPTTPDRVLLSVALRYSRALFGVEFGLKAQYPGIVESIVEMEGARMRCGTAGAASAVEIVDLLYLENTGTEFVTFPLPLEVFRSLARTPQPTFGRIDTERVYLEFDLSAAFFEALANGFVRECLRATGGTPGGPVGAQPATTSAYGVYSSSVIVNIAVLRVREAPGLDAAVVGRVEHGEYGDVLSGIHQDADGFRWWRVRFWNGADGWVADGDDELNYLVRTVDKQPLAPLVPLPPFEPLAERLLTAAGARQVMCPEAYRGTPGPVCAVGPERGTGSFESVAEPMRVPMVELLLAEGFRLAHDWEYDGNDIGIEISAAFTDGTRAVRLGIVDSAWEPLALVMIQQFHLWP